MSAPTLRQLAADLASGATTSQALVGAALERIAEHRAGGGAAYVALDAPRALAAARISDAMRAAGHVPSPLAGLPVSIKDLFDVREEVTSAGSRILADSPPAQADAVAVGRLRAAGAVLLGRTNMSEFAFSGLGLNPHYGTPRNPLDADRVAGGSTSGGAVSVALGMAAATLGTDTGGSVRIPAAFCGLTGFKPTASRVPLDGAVPLSSSLDSIGPIGRSVECCALLDSILSGQTLDDEIPPVAGLRLGVTDDHVGAADEVVRATFERALERLAAAGARIVRFAFPELAELPAINAGGGFTAAESWAWHRPLIGRGPELYDPRVIARIRRGAGQSAADYLDLLAARRRLIALARRRLAPFDAWLMPTVAVVPPAIAPLEAADDAFFAANGQVLRNTTTINFLDGCALSLPCHGPDALPVGLAICGLGGRDGRILAIGRALEPVIATNPMR